MLILRLRPVLSATGLVLAALAASACGMGQLVREARDVGRGGVSGELALEGPTFGGRTLTPHECRSGDRFSFFGVDLSDAEQEITLRLIEDPAHGPIVRVFDRAQAAKGEGVFFRPALCHTLERDLEQTGWRVNEVRDVSGSLELECAAAGGDRIAGKLTFTHCH